VSILRGSCMPAVELLRKSRSLVVKGNPPGSAAAYTLKLREAIAASRRCAELKEK
jgi:hypothetical protein